MRILDFHAHAFPDAIAPAAMRMLNAAVEQEYAACLDGTLGDLLRSMDACGIEKAVLASIATRPQQFQSILDWSISIASGRIIPFPSVHPADPDFAAHVDAIAEAGFKGIKLHPYYQDFDLDEERINPLYEAIARNGLVLLIHTGYDMAFERTRKANAARTLNVIERFPDLKFAASHLMAWEDWDDAKERALGKPIYTDISCSVQYMPPERARDLLSAHPAEYILFGTDSPWADQQDAIDAVRALDMGADWERAVFHDNAARLLGLD